jgi:cytochrome b561
MTYRNTIQRYGRVAKLFHWVIFILVVSVLAIGFLLDSIHNKDFHSTVVNIHKIIGLFILVLMILRALWALNNPKPTMENFLVKYGHFFIYFLLIVTPVVGWVRAMAGGHAPHIFGLNLSLPIEKNAHLKYVSGVAHYWLAWVIIVVVSLHILIALYHHFVKKDDVLKRMM